MTRRPGVIDIDKMHAFGAGVTFGKTAADYARHRAGFPPAFFELLVARGWAQTGQTVVDLGCGTGTIARGLALLGATVTGVDPARALMDEARSLDRAAGVKVAYQEARAEATGLASGSVDLVTAGQCWHWFDRRAAAKEVNRLLKRGGRAVVAHFDWLPLSGNVVEATEALILHYNPTWAGSGGTGVYPEWLIDLAQVGLRELETASFDVMVRYTHADWRGRIRASAGVAASLDQELTKALDTDLAKILARDFAINPIVVPHRVWMVTGIAEE
ncbi:MAG: class I SAM-dependent methyltransferase [Pseudomonadota bacterium]